MAKELGYTDVEFKESPSAQRETLLQSGQVKMIFATYSITDDRKQKVSFARPVLHRRSGPAGQGRQHRHHRSGQPERQEAVLGHRLDVGARRSRTSSPTEVQLQEYDTYSKCVEALNTGAIDAVTTDNVILAGFAAQPQYQGKLKVVGKPFSTEKLRRRHQEGRHRAVRRRSTPR